MDKVFTTTLVKRAERKLIDDKRIIASLPTADIAPTEDLSDNGTPENTVDSDDTKEPMPPTSKRDSCQYSQINISRTRKKSIKFFYFSFNIFLDFIYKKENWKIGNNELVVEFTHIATNLLVHIKYFQIFN